MLTSASRSADAGSWPAATPAVSARSKLARRDPARRSRPRGDVLRGFRWPAPVGRADRVRLDVECGVGGPSRARRCSWCPSWAGRARERDQLVPVTRRTGWPVTAATVRKSWSSVSTVRRCRSAVTLMRRSTGPAERWWPVSVRRCWTWLARS
jgi:hypothetical protein